MSSKSKSKDKKKHRARESHSSDASIGPFGISTALNLSDLHHRSSKDIRKALERPSIKPAAPRKEEKPKEPVSEEKQKKRDLKEQQKREEEAAKKLGLLNLLKVPKPLQKKFTQRLHEQQKSLFEFVLLKIAPIEFSIDATVDDATEAIRMMTGAQDVEISTARTKIILEDMIELRMLRHLGRKLGLSKHERQIIVEKHFPPPQARSKDTDALRAMLRQRIDQTEKVTNPKPASKSVAPKKTGAKRE